MIKKQWSIKGILRWDILETIMESIFPVARKRKKAKTGINTVTINTWKKMNIFSWLTKSDPLKKRKNNVAIAGMNIGWKI